MMCPFCPRYKEVEDDVDEDTVVQHVMFHHCLDRWMCFCGRGFEGDSPGEELDDFRRHIIDHGGIQNHANDYLIGVSTCKTNK